MICRQSAENSKKSFKKVDKPKLKSINSFCFLRTFSLTTQRKNDNKGFRNDDEETGSSRRLFGNREGQKSELIGDTEEANYGGENFVF